MKKFKTLAILLCIFVASIPFIQADTSNDEDLSKQVVELKKQIEILEKRIKSLEKQVQLLSDKSIEIPKTFPKLQKLPEGWKEFEFNGVKYYTIPLKSDTKKTNQKKK